jgi:hypothetical protein
MRSSISLACTSYSTSSNCISVQRQIALHNTTYNLLQIQDVVYHRCIGRDHTQSFRLFCVYWKQTWWRYLIFGRKRHWDVVCVCVCVCVSKRFGLFYFYWNYTLLRYINFGRERHTACFDEIQFILHLLKSDCVKVSDIWERQRHRLCVCIFFQFSK